MTKPKPEKADQDNNRKVIAFTIHPELLNGLDTEAAKLKISRSEVVNRILLAHFDPKPPQVNQSDFKAMQATVEQISEAVNKLLSERSLSESTPSVQKPLIDTPAPPADDFEQAMANVDADPELTPRPTLAPCLDDWLKMTDLDFGQSLANQLEFRPVKRGAFDWSLVKGNEAIEQELKRLTKLYGKRLVELLISGRTDLKTMRLKEICDMSERARRCALLELAGITF